jgi:hypothetical protein
LPRRCLSRGKFRDLGQLRLCSIVDGPCGRWQCPTSSHGTNRVQRVRPTLRPSRGRSSAGVVARRSRGARWCVVGVAGRTVAIPELHRTGPIGSCCAR